MDSKELLESEEERSMLLKELPKVISDAKVDCDGASWQSENAAGVNEGNGNPSDKMSEGEDEGTGVFSILKTRKRGRPKGKKAQPNKDVAPTEENVAVDHQAGGTAGLEENSQGLEISVRLSELLSTNLPARQEQFPDAWISPNSAGNIAVDHQAGGTAGHEGNIAVDHQAGGTAGHEEPGQPLKKHEANVIDLDDSDEEETAEQKKQTSVLPMSQWLYKDPQGVTQGPFPLSFLRAWSKQGFFERSFMVWQSGQDPNDAALLTVVLRSAFPDA
ncbi:hypothetical protein H6P81_018144 [Aristolochia fimbriata]|uniref:GYF domain-containing protein n=1 Tax=Aristolochia fimbriata TaxID=158543 RepID=A0AAV7E056_ARIFI|nr:hypothetical protein H6P81_018144 [Aristolochia fimbriata]